MNANSSNVVFFSSCLDTWGGSEELWSQAAELLAQKNYQVHIFKINIDFSHPRIKKLLKLGCRITDLKDSLPILTKRVSNLFSDRNSSHPILFYVKYVLARKINKIKPKLFVISQGANFDGLFFIRNCSFDKLRYVLISQKATDSLWAADGDRVWMKKILQNAAANFFVSDHNLRITQEQFGIKFKNAEVVRNPFLIQVEKPLPWTFNSEDKVKLACIGRLFPLDKGQDILLRVLANEKWQQRNIEVSFFGNGNNEQGLKDLAQFLKLNNVVFKGHVSDVHSIWKEHRALVLPSRAEGLPLVLVEAMLSGRTAIVNDIGGNSEILEDNVTGFISKSPDERSFDEALERAWRRLDEWENIGALAADKIRSLVPSNPARNFSEKLISIIETEIPSV